MRPALIAFASLALAQSIPSDEIRSKTTSYTPPQLTLRTEVRVVEVPVVVRDPQHRTVAGLTRDDFAIFDDGKKQQITAFSLQSHAAQAADEKTQPRPRFLALCFDDLHLGAADLKLAKDAAERFVKASLSPGDRAAIITTSKPNKSVFTADTATLLENIAKVTFIPQSVPDGKLMCTTILPEEAYQIAKNLDPGGAVLRRKVTECSACYDPRNPCHEEMIKTAADSLWSRISSNTVSTLGVVDSLVDGMANLPGQRIIVLTSDGFLIGAVEPEVDRLMAKALHAEVVINSLDPRGVATATTDSQGMAALADGTGGSYFHNQNNLDDGFRELGTVPETIYVLTFTPPAAADGRFHKLKVQLAKKYSVQSRQGYMAVAAIAEAPSKLDSAASASDTIGDLPVTFTWEQAPSGVMMIAHLDLGHMRFKPYQDRHTQRLTIVAVLRDAQGAFIAGKRSELELSLKDATLQQFDKTPFSVALTLNAPPGNYTARAVAQDALESAQSAATTPIEIK